MHQRASEPVKIHVINSESGAPYVWSGRQEYLATTLANNSKSVLSVGLDHET